MAVSSPLWFANVAALGERHPVYAVDTITDAGRSVQTGEGQRIGRVVRRANRDLEPTLGAVEG